jgi:hypothetical protein
MKVLYEKIVFFFIPIAWCLYSLFVFANGNCDLQMKMTNDGKYDIFYTNTVDDIGDGYITTNEYERIYMESLNLNEAEKIINDCVRESEIFMKKYATIYNLKTDELTIDLMLWFLYFIIPYVFIYMLYKRNK